jgi:hypothetical protein
VPGAWAGLRHRNGERSQAHTLLALSFDESGWPAGYLLIATGFPSEASERSGFGFLQAVKGDPQLWPISFYIHHVHEHERGGQGEEAGTRRGGLSALRDGNRKPPRAEIRDCISARGMN